MTEDLVLPRHGEATLAEIVPSALAALGVAGHQDPLGLGRARVVVVLVVDGLGWHQLQAHTDAAPTLASAVGGPIDAVLPATTVAGLASIGTGRPPAGHGMVGYAVAHPDHLHPLNLLGWRIGLRGGGFDAREEIVPESLVPAPTAFERASAAGVMTTVILHPDFVDSGLTRAALRGGARHAVADLDGTIAAITRLAAHQDTPSLIYAHHPEVDWRGHVDGPGSDSWRAALGRIDKAVDALAKRLPEQALLLVTADHGMVEVAADAPVEVSDHPLLEDGVRVLAGEPRLRQLALDGTVATSTVMARWRRVLGERAEVIARDDAVAAGWFGGALGATAQRLLGDVLISVHRGSAAHRRVDPHEGRHRGQHGARTAAEVAVPLLRIPGGR